MDRPLQSQTRPTIKAEQRALDLRKHLTTPERVLWSRLRDRQLGGFKFRRQHPLGPYIADFYCDAAALVVELDSEWHRYDRVEHDRRRDEWMVERNILTLRVSASALATNEGSVLAKILAVAVERAGRIDAKQGVPDGQQKVETGSPHLTSAKAEVGPLPPGCSGRRHG